jgi:hypothetical protein
MEKLTGIVASLRHSTEVHGGDHGTTINHVAIFELSGRPVELKLPESIFISPGDEVVVAGEVKRGLFRGMAYRNRTKGVDGKYSTGVFRLVGVVFCAVVVFLPIGLYLFRMARKYDAAFASVTAE